MRQKYLKLDNIDSIALRMILERAIQNGSLDQKEGTVAFINLKHFAEKIVEDIDSTFELTKVNTEEVKNG